MKTAFVSGGVVVSWGQAHAEGVTITSAVPDATSYEVADDVALDVGWTVTVTDDVPSFAAPEAGPVYRDLTVMQFYLAFMPQERVLLKALALTGIPANSPLLGGANAAIPIDPMIAEFWATFQLAVATGSLITPRHGAIQAGLAYLSAAHGATPVVLAPGRAEEICNALAG